MKKKLFSASNPNNTHSLGLHEINDLYAFDPLFGDFCCCKISNFKGFSDFSFAFGFVLQG
jgi:hypothetical protein